MTYIFMGSCDFARTALAEMAQYISFSAVYTAPPQPQGRGYKTKKTPVHIFAEERGWPVYTPHTLKDLDVQATLRALTPDMIVVASYGYILPQAVLDIPRYGCLNIHPSLLPRWRGASPLTSTLLAGDTVTGVCVMVMDAGMDTGPLLHVEEIPVLPHMDKKSLSLLLAAEGGRALCSILPRYLSGTLIPYAQKTEGISLAKKIKKEDGLLDWKETAHATACRIRAFQPWPGTWFLKNKQRFGILEALEDNNTLYDGVPPGTLVYQNGMRIICADKRAIRCLLLRTPHGKIVSGEDFFKGYRSLFT